MGRRKLTEAQIAEREAAKSLALEREVESRRRSALKAKIVAEENAAKRELARRELARRRLLPFVMRFEPQYMPGWVHKDICQRLEKFSQDVVDGKSPRLMIQMPPRHGKSVLASVNFPAWHLGRNPRHEIIACSYASTLAVSFSRKVRARVADAGFNQLFSEAKLDGDNKSAEAWMTTVGGGYVAAGVGGGITGKGAHILIIDDPVKNAEDADSDTARQAAKDWYGTTAYTRLAPGGGVLIIQTRWHDDDLSGWLLEVARKADEDLADNWEVVQYPAVALEDEPYRAKDEPLHPARYDAKALRRIRAAVGERAWWALYQQRPVADEGSYFTRGMLKYYGSTPPTNMRTYAAWDLAIGRGERNDFTVGIVVGVDEHDDIYVLDMIRGKWDSYEIVEQMLDVHKRYRTEINGVEKGQIELTMKPILDKRIAERRMYSFFYEPLPPGRRDKELRARPIQARMQQGKVLLPANAPWLADMVHELLRFPNGVHDDIVDALAWIGQMLNELMAAQAIKPQSKKSWKDKLGSAFGRSRPPMAA